MTRLQTPLDGYTARITTLYQERGRLVIQVGLYDPDTQEWTLRSYDGSLDLEAFIHHCIAAGHLRLQDFGGVS